MDQVTDALDEIKKEKKARDKYFSMCTRKEQASSTKYLFMFLRSLFVFTDFYQNVIKGKLIYS